MPTCNSMTICPKCFRDAQDNLLEVHKTYGVVPAYEYGVNLRVAKERLDALGKTFYENVSGFVMMDGTLKISFTGKCRVCNFEVHRELQESAL